MPTLKVAFLWAMQLFLDDSHLEVIGSGPQGPVVIDRHTHQEVTQSKVRAAEEHGGEKAGAAPQAAPGRC